MFQIEDPVLVKALKRKGRIKEITKSGTYRVALGNMLILVSAAELELIEENVKKKTPSKKVRASYPKLRQKINLPICLDLHGLNSSESEARVESYIEQAVRADLSEVQIMHGIGTGKLRATVHACLRKLRVVSAFKLDEANPGVTRVYL